MKWIFPVIITIFLLIGSDIRAQSEPKNYTVGDTFPNYRFIANQGDSSYTFTIDSFRGKAVVLDLWNLYCKGCIYGLGKLDSLQKRYEDKLQIILVSKNSRQEIEKLFHSRIGRPDLISVTEDTIVYDHFFPHYGDPLGVWIDQNGIIKYITPGYNTTDKNLMKFFNNEPLNVSYQAKLKDFNSEGPFINEVASRLQFYTKAYSVFTAGLQDLTNTFQIKISRDSSTNAPYSLKSLNNSRLILFQLAYNFELYGFDLNMFRLTKNNRVVLASDRAKTLKAPSEIEYLDNWRRDNSFCYELFLPDVSPSRFYLWMQQDLQRFFDFDVSIKYIERECLVLENNVKENQGNPGLKLMKQNTWIDSSNLNSKIEDSKRQGLQELIYLTQEWGFPLVDDTESFPDSTLRLPQYVQDIQELNKILQVHELCISVKPRKIKSLIIK